MLCESTYSQHSCGRQLTTVPLLRKPGPSRIFLDVSGTATASPGRTTASRGTDAMVPFSCRSVVSFIWVISQRAFEMNEHGNRSHFGLSKTVDS